MAVNPDLNREGIVQYLTLMELGYEELPLAGALKCAQRVLVESDFQFIRENDEYLNFEIGTPLQVRLRAILAIFDQEAAEYGRQRLQMLTEMIQKDTEKALAEAGITLGPTTVVTRESLARELKEGSGGWILASKHKLPSGAGNASVNTDLVRELFKPHPKDDVPLDPFSHPDDEV